MKKNECNIVFLCDAPTDCIYRKETNRKEDHYEFYCEYEMSGVFNDYLCNSKVAQANSMALKLKELGLDIINKKEIK